MYLFIAHMKHKYNSGYYEAIFVVRAGNRNWPITDSSFSHCLYLNFRWGSFILGNADSLYVNGKQISIRFFTSLILFILVYYLFLPNGISLYGSAPLAVCRNMFNERVIEHIIVLGCGVWAISQYAIKREDA